MTITLKNGRPASHSDVDTLQREIGITLPTSFLRFVLENDGADADANVFAIEGLYESGISGFIPVREVFGERTRIEDLASTIFPIAWAEGGNYVLIDAASGVVYFWDHEQPTPLIQLARDFSTFIDMLKPFDVDSVNLKPGQVKSAWIDPDFFKNLEQ